MIVLSLVFYSTALVIHATPGQLRSSILQLCHYVRFTPGHNVSHAHMHSQLFDRHLPAYRQLLVHTAIMQQVNLLPMTFHGVTLYLESCNGLYSDSFIHNMSTGVTVYSGPLTTRTGRSLLVLCWI